MLTDPSLSLCDSHLDIAAEGRHHDIQGRGYLRQLQATLCTPHTFANISRENSVKVVVMIMVAGSWSRLMEWPYIYEPLVIAVTNSNQALPLFTQTRLRDGYDSPVG